MKYLGQFTKPLEWNRQWINRQKNARAFQFDGFFSGADHIYDEAMLGQLYLTESIASDEGVIVLKGDPGLGKTTELSKIANAIRTKEGKDKIIETSARQYESVSHLSSHLTSKAAWKNWIDDGDGLTIFIDGVDEGLIRIPTLLSSLIPLLEDCPIKNLRLILCCRSAEWPESEGDRVLELWSEKNRHVYELCPLQREDAITAADAMDLNGEDFIEAIYDTNVAPLGCRPITLLFLLVEYQQGTLQDLSFRDLYKRGCSRLCRESNPIFKQGASLVSVEQKLSASKKLACHLLLGAKSNIHLAEGSLDSSSDNDLRIDAILEGDPDYYENIYTLAIRTALFTSN